MSVWLVQRRGNHVRGLYNSVPTLPHYKWTIRISLYRFCQTQSLRKLGSCEFWAVKAANIVTKSPFLQSRTSAAKFTRLWHQEKKDSVSVLHYICSTFDIFSEEDYIARSVLGMPRNSCQCTQHLNWTLITLFSIFIQINLIGNWIRYYRTWEPCTEYSVDTLEGDLSDCNNLFAVEI